jgi:hypothetical protein
LERANGQQPFPQAAISCRYFGSGLDAALAWKRPAKPQGQRHSVFKGALHTRLPRGREARGEYLSHTAPITLQRDAGVAKILVQVTDNDDGALQGCAYWRGQGLPGSGVNRLSQCNLKAAAETPGDMGARMRFVPCRMSLSRQIMPFYSSVPVVITSPGASPSFCR